MCTITLYYKNYIQKRGNSYSKCSVWWPPILIVFSYSHSVCTDVSMLNKVSVIFIQNVNFLHNEFLEQSNCLWHTSKYLILQYSPKPRITRGKIVDKMTWDRHWVGSNALIKMWVVRANILMPLLWQCDFMTKLTTKDTTTNIHNDQGHVHLSSDTNTNNIYP